MKNSGRRILIVDDLQENRELLGAVLSRHDYQTANAGDGIEALEKLRAGSFDLIITDVLMPRMDGFQLCREVKRDEGLESIPVVFYTATYTDPKDEELAMSVGAAIYIVKPLELLKFLTVIEKIIIEPPPKTKPAPTAALKEDAAFLTQYNQRLIQQLEKKLIELNEARAASKVSETKYRTVADFTYNWEYWVTPEGKFIYSSPSFKRISGYENDMLAKNPENLFDAIHEEDRPAFKKHFEKAIQDTLTIHNLEFRIVRRDGGTRWLSHTCQPVYDQEGHFIGRRASNGDITDRKAAENALRESEEKYRSLTSTVDSMYLVDRDCRFLVVNKQHLTRFGLLAEQVIGRKHSEFHAAEDSVIFENYVKQVFETGEPHQDEYRSARDGRYFVRTLSPITDAHGMTSAVTVVAKDITERKRLEGVLNETLAKLRQSTDTLAQTLAATVEVRDSYTAGHQQRVAVLAKAIASEMGWSEERIAGLVIAGGIHDIGKISVPAEILSKPTRLSDTEFSLIKTHPQTAYNILKDIPFPWPISEMVYQHHERLDGSGYPRGLKGEEIMLEARIMIVADVVEAMASHRPYRPAQGLEKAMEEITKNRDVFYDPVVVDVCLRLFREKVFQL